MKQAKRLLRVLHVVGSMNRGGAETWLMNVLRNIDRGEFRIDFLVHSATPGAYDDEIRNLGSQIIYCPWTGHPLQYAHQLHRVLSESGPYDIVHSHVHYFSGFVLCLAARSGVPARINHSHSDTSQVDTRARWCRRLYHALMRHWLDRYATYGLAASDLAASALWGPNWRRVPNRQVLHCGIDLEPFTIIPAPQTARADLGLPLGVPIIGHVGRFDVMKNHRFLLQIAKQARNRNIPLMLLFMGDGPLREAIEQETQDMGLGSCIKFAGLRADVPQVLLGAVDAFMLPSLWEGLPLSAIEAQAAGLPLLLSDSITHEVVVIPELVYWLALADGPDTWLDTCLAALSQQRVIAQQHALRILAGSTFDIKRNVYDLTKIYRLST